MPLFPKFLTVRGVEIRADSWEEVDELLARYGEAPAEPAPARRTDAAGLSREDRALLKQFVDAAERGIPVKKVRDALGADGKVGSALKAWSRRIGLEAMSGPPLFVPNRRADGRAHRLSDNALKAARALLSGG